MARTRTTTTNGPVNDGAPGRVDARQVVPARYRNAAVPHVMVAEGAAAIDFYTRAFGAREEFRIETPEGGILHAEVRIAESVVMVGDATGPFAAPAALGGASVAVHVWVPDVDALTERAAAAGAEVLQEPADQFHGDRTAILRDPDGHVWIFLTHLRDFAEHEVSRRIINALT
ncbi:VOC family protein [Streptomyces sp. NPDC093225]|uniref:VOC family protein n=1 Tax=Streptomyces sp. NPDC093225 TaxID=3366034 RepID=UPI00381AF82C